MPKISNPTATSGVMTEGEMDSYVKNILVPIVDKFVKTHKGKEFKESDIEKLYKDLNDSLSKDPRILDKWSGGVDQYAVRKQMASETTKEINTVTKLSSSDKLIQGFGKFCKKIGLEKIGGPCLKHTQKVNLTKAVEGIASKVASTKTSFQVGDSASARIAKPIKPGGRER
jgi:hypothetical protein